MTINNEKFIQKSSKIKKFLTLTLSEQKTEQSEGSWGSGGIKPIGEVKENNIIFAFKKQNRQTNYRVE